MINTLVESFNIFKPIVQSFHPAAKRALYIRTALETTFMTRVAYLSYRSLGERIVSRIPPAATTFLRNNPAAQAGLAAVAVITLALAFFKMESARGVKAFRSHLERYNDLNPILQNCINANSFAPYKTVLDVKASKEETISFDSLLLAIQNKNPAFAAYAFDKHVAPSLLKDGIVKCWSAVQNDKTAVLLQKMGYDINARNQENDSAMTYALLSGSIDATKRLQKFGALLTLTNTSQTTISAIKAKIGKNVEFKELFKNHAHAQQLIFA